MNFKSIFLIICLGSLGCSPLISESLNEKIINSKEDLSIITPKAAFFVFKVEPQQVWTWRNFDKYSSVHQVEYGWQTKFALNGEKYSCGFNLYSSSNAKKSSGSLKQLLKAGQTDFISREAVYDKKLSNDFRIVKESVDQRKFAKIKSIAKSNAVVIILQEKDIIDQFRKSRPDSISFERIEPSTKKSSQYKVAVSYSEGLP